MARTARRGPAQALYRTRQVASALRPRIAAGELALTRTLLTEPQQRLFCAMEKRDQRHALEVLRRLREANVDDADLQTAALLHDCGKGAVPVWLRIAEVLSPWAVRAVAAETAAGWRGAAYRLANHPALGARAASEAGVSAGAVSLICGRPTPEVAWKAELLRAADDLS